MCAPKLDLRDCRPDDLFTFSDHGPRNSVRVCGLRDLLRRTFDPTSRTVVTSKDGVTSDAMPSVIATIAMKVAMAKGATCEARERHRKGRGSRHGRRA